MRSSRRRCTRRPARKRPLGNPIGILETLDQPVARLLLQNLHLDTDTGLRHAWRSPGADHGPANLRDGDRRAEKAHRSIRDGELALMKHPRKRAAQLALDLRATLPPPAQDVDQISVIGKQTRVARRIVPIPSVRLFSLKPADSRFVIRLSSARDSPNTKDHQRQQCKSAQRPIHHGSPRVDQAALGPAYTLNLKCITSPSRTIYSFPSSRSLPASFDPASPLLAMKSP